MNLSVVIPTLGGVQLKKTIKALQNNSVKPSEILICIPKSSHLEIDIDTFDNIEMVITSKKGQVFQRMSGFMAAKGELVMQIDDDVVLERNTIKELIHNLIILGGNTAVAPATLKDGSNLSVFSINRNSFSRRISDWIMNGSKGFNEGVISKVGIGFGFDFDKKNRLNIESEWLLGGCILHYAKNLIFEDYYPFPGKAYSEDLIHSILLRSKNIKLYVCNNAIAYIDGEAYSDELLELYYQFLSTKYVVKLQKQGYLRVHLFYLLKLINSSSRLFSEKILNLIKKASNSKNT
jgi:glycosyltransferase involved in cell wall biosynthesis